MNTGFSQKYKVIYNLALFKLAKSVAAHATVQDHARDDRGGIKQMAKIQDAKSDLQIGVNNFYASLILVLNNPLSRSPFGYLYRVVGVCGCGLCA